MEVIETRIDMSVEIQHSQCTRIVVVCSFIHRSLCHFHIHTLQLTPSQRKGLSPYSHLN